MGEERVVDSVGIDTKDGIRHAAPRRGPPLRHTSIHTTTTGRDAASSPTPARKFPKSRAAFQLFPTARTSVIRLPPEPLVRAKLGNPANQPAPFVEWHEGRIGNGAVTAGWTPSGRVVLNQRRIEYRGRHGRWYEV